MANQLGTKSILDSALEQAPGEGLELDFPTTAERERFRWSCYAAMSSEARAARRETATDSAGWGEHPWTGLRVVRRGSTGLWIGQRVDVEVIVVKGVKQKEEG